MQAYVDAVWTMRDSNKLSLTNDFYWSATSATSNSLDGYVVSPATGETKTRTKTLDAKVVCVR